MLKYKLGDWVVFKHHLYTDDSMLGQIVGVDTTPYTSNYLVYSIDITNDTSQIYKTIEGLKEGFTYGIRNGYLTFKEDADFSKTTWVHKEDIIRRAEVPDSKLARDLYKNQITGEETRNGQTFLILGVK
jgi:hypothetical protein